MDSAEFISIWSELPVLREWAEEGLVAFDYDGTLAPLTREPEAAFMPDSTRSLLVDLAKRRPVAVVTGRGLEDVMRRVEGVPLVGLVGNHGAEVLGQQNDYSEQMKQSRLWAEMLQEQFASDRTVFEGVSLEQKNLSFSLHFRKATHPDVEALLMGAVEKLQPGRLVLGKKVINVLPSGLPNKADGLRSLMKNLGKKRAVFLGDDITDDDVFEMPRETVFSIQVGPRASSKAQYLLPSQTEMDKLLQALL